MRYLTIIFPLLILSSALNAQSQAPVRVVFIQNGDTLKIKHNHFHERMNLIALGGKGLLDFDQLNIGFDKNYVVDTLLLSIAYGRKIVNSRYRVPSDDTHYVDGKWKLVNLSLETLDSIAHTREARAWSKRERRLIGIMHLRNVNTGIKRPVVFSFPWVRKGRHSLALARKD
jgi:hypothetical protein